MLALTFDRRRRWFAFMDAFDSYHPHHGHDSLLNETAWMLGHPGFTKWTYDSSDPEKSPDEVLDDVTLYWLTNSAASSGRLTSGPATSRYRADQADFG